MAQLFSMLREAAVEYEREGQPRSVQRFVLRHGRPFRRLAPGRRRLMEPNNCFENAMRFARENGLTYVEGYALKLVPGPFVFDHGWCVDSDENVYEVTWDDVGLAYFGVPFAWGYIDRRLANEHERRHGNGSLLTSNGRGDLLYECAPDWRA
jgi:hypothetical protein